VSRRVWFRTASVLSCVALAATAPSAAALTRDSGAASGPSVAADPGGTHTVVLGLAGDTWVSSLGTTTSQSTSPELRVGSNNLGLTKSRSYLDFDYSGLAEIPAGAVISSAQLSLSNFVTGACAGTAIRASRVTGAWTLAGLKWSAQPAVTTLGSGTSTSSYGAPACPTEGTATFDVSGIVSSWVGGSATRGIQIKADKEGLSTGYRVYRSAENGDTAKAPTLTVTYDSYPDTPTAVAASPGTPGYSSSLAPTLSATLTDPDDDPVSGTFVVRKGTTLLSPIVWTGSSDPVASGETASVTMPDGLLVEGTTYSVAVTGDDGSLQSKAIGAAKFKVDVTAPDLVITSDVYTDGEWLTSDPASTKFTFDGSPDTAGFYLTVDGTDYTVGSNAAGGDYTVTFKPTPGWHVVTATPVDKAGNVGAEQTFGFGAGAPAFIVPTEWEGSTADFPVDFTAPADATGAVLQWRVWGESTWHDANHVDKGEAAWDGSVSNDGAHADTGLLTWHATSETLGTGTLKAPLALQVRGCFQYDDAPDACTPDRFVQLVTE
jgi:hypothetical protein